MPRIDPLQLLKCLSVLLAPDGGIKSREEVSRLVSLMTKFSKKLVSKCIYIQILRATKSDLLDMFMAAGGWNLTHQWLLDAIMAKNHPLNCEILQLLALCPVNVERLRSNSCPKLVKGLSLENSDENEKLLASNLVIQWMEVVRNEVEVGKDNAAEHDAAVVDTAVADKSEAVNTVSVDVVVETSVDTRTSETTSNSVSINKSLSEVVSAKSLEKQDVESEETHKIPIVDGEERTEEGGGTSEDSNSPWDAPLPLYKIMIRDGKQVLAKVYSEKRPPPDIPSDEIPSIDHNVSGAVIVNVPPSDENVVNVEQASETPVTVAPSPVPPHSNENAVKDEVAADSEALETNELESEKKTKPSSCDSSSVKNSEVTSKMPKENKKKPKEPKAAIHSSSEKKSRILESGPSKEKHKEKDRERGRNKEKVKEEKKKDSKSSLQAEKDKETLAKIMIVSSAVSKTVGKIPKKKASTEDSNSEVKKATPATHEVRRTQKPSVSIEVRRSQGSLGEPRPKTVKTFNSKFRSTGLEEEVKPPPPRNTAKKTAADKNARLPIPSRRPSPPREIFPPEKKPRAGAGNLTEVAPTVPAYASDELPRKGDKANAKMNSIKAKDKPSVAFLQESDVFMDALTAVTRKEPRRRKRRISSSKDDDKPKGKETEIKKEESGDTHGGTPPYSPDEKSPPVLKPSFKFYQDTLETDDEVKKVKEENLSDEERKVTTPTPKDDGSPSAENDASDDDSKLKGLKKRTENDSFLARKRIKKEEDDDSSGSEDNLRRKETLSKGLRGVLVYHKRMSMKSKKTVKWKEDGELEKVVYFELDETERVNVTKTFMDMKQMERTHEREAFQMARKLAHEDIMEERMQWKPLIPLALPPPLAEPGSKSREKDVQYAREKVVLQSLYFHRDMIPDSPSEPDNENHPTTDPAVIPLNDASGNPDSINDFQSTPWPEPKSLQPPIPASPSIVGPSGPSGPGGVMPGMPEHSDPNFMAQHPHPHIVQGHPMIGGGIAVPFGGAMHPNQMGAHTMHGGFNAPMGGPAMTGAQMGSVDNSMHQRASHVMMSNPRPMMHVQNSQQVPMTGMMNPGIQGVASSGGDWRTADGKVVPVDDSQPMVMYAQGGVGDVGMGGNNVPSMEGEMTAGYEVDYGVQYQEGMEETPGGGPGYMMPPMNYAGAATNNVRPPHSGAMYGHPPMFRGSGSRGGRGGPTPRGGPWFRPNGPPRGRGGGGGNWEMGRGRGGRGNLRVTPCKHFRAGYCRNGDQCSFLHPGVNGPPVPYMYSE